MSYQHPHTLLQISHTLQSTSRHSILYLSFYILMLICQLVGIRSTLEKPKVHVELGLGGKEDRPEEGGTT